MHKKFDHEAIEKKWQEKWDQDELYDIEERDTSKEKEFVLVEFPYPSGNLHIGHWHAFAVPDIYVRTRRMQGKQVLYPIGFDAFGLPAENAAIKRGLDPKQWTHDNIEHMKGQLQSMGNAFSWNREVQTIDPEYYKWTQWMFTKFFEKSIAYKGSAVVNWDPIDKTVVANEQVLPDGTAERSGAVIEKKEMPQWMLKITDYADRLIDDLETVNWPEHIKESQRQWIGRSEGAELTFTLSTGDDLAVFTTRPDTLFGVTYMVLAPEHELVEKNKDKISNCNEVTKYIHLTKKKSEQDRLDDTKEKTGIKLEGIRATNPGNGEEVPVFIADYVLAGYGTGAIMAVPAHDQRDYEFAKKYKLPVTYVVRPVFGEPTEGAEPRKAVTAFIYNPKTDQYLFIKSHEFNRYGKIFGGVEGDESYETAAVREALEETGYTTKFVRYVGGECESHFYHPGKKVHRELISRCVLLEVTDDTRAEVDPDELRKHEPVWMTLKEAKKHITEERESFEVSTLLKDTVFTGSGSLTNSGEFDDLSSEEAKKSITEKVGGTVTATYRLRDWSIGRQRYWGTPIPIVYDPEGKAHAVPEEHLPWLLPEDVDFTPTGEPPLAKSEELKERTENIFGKGWTPEVETMDTFVDSSWYFLRYLDSKNSKEFSSKNAQQDWMQVDTYFGGAEHTTMHLLYSRFWQKALFDLGLVTESEPYKKRINRGLVLGPDGNKMSKSKGNVIDPDEQVKRLGSDTVKMYLAFMGPYGETANYPWNMGGIAGIRRFLERVWGLSEHITDAEPEEITQLLHRTIQKITDDIEKYKFNTSISALMIFVNAVEKAGLSENSYNTFLKLLAPFAPHVSEELWELRNHTSSIHSESWPVSDASLAATTQTTIAVQVNSKVRATITVATDTSEDEAVATAKAIENVQKWLREREVHKIIYVPNKILNFITS